MSPQEMEVSEDIYNLMVAPLWLEIITGAVEIMVVVMVIIIAHYLAKRKAVGGFNMLLCVYLSILTAIVPMAITMGSDVVAGSMISLFFYSRIASGILAFLAFIHLFRFVRSVFFKNKELLESGK